MLDHYGKPAGGLASYQSALALSRKHEGDNLAIALALRGIGYCHIELGDLEAGERAYRESLKVEPGNALA
ncbi:MAG TPA: hypothetical protein VLC71_01820 [Thermomonas sp.]|nr:hypothetical protein [Thermomonas sp.]